MGMGREKVKVLDLRVARKTLRGEDKSSQSNVMPFACGRGRGGTVLPDNGLGRG